MKTEMCKERGLKEGRHKWKEKEIREKEIESEGRQENTRQWKNMEENEEHIQNMRQMSSGACFNYHNNFY